MALEEFYGRWKEEGLVVLKWLALQVCVVTRRANCACTCSWLCACARVRACTCAGVERRCMCAREGGGVVQRK